MLYPKYFFCTAILLLSTLLPAAAQQNQDSLRNIIQHSTEDKEKIKAYRSLSDILALKNFDDCINISLAGSNLAEKTKDISALGHFQKQVGLAYYFKGDYDSAAGYYYKAINTLNRPADAEEKADLLNVMGRLYRKSKDLDRALQLYDEALAIYESRNNLDGMATILNESGVVFEYKKDYTEAINRYTRSLAIREKLNDLAGKAYSINFIGGVYTLEKKYPEAEKYLLQSLAIRKQIKDSFAIALNYADLAYMYTEQGKFDKAIEQYNLSIVIATTMQYADLLLGNYRELSAIAEKKGDPKLSLAYYKKHIDIKDSIYSADKMKQIEELNAKYQTEKKEQLLRLQKAEITQKNYLLWGLTASVILVIFGSFSFYRKRQLQNKMQLQNTIMKQQDIATKAVIAAEENERKRIAADLHDGVGQMMSAAKMNLSAFENEIPFVNDQQRSSFEKVIALVDESCKEVRSVSHQMMPNALLKSGLASAVKEFIDKIDSRILKINLYTEGLNERLETNTETVLYRVIQECVNNVIKHSGANQLDISLIKDSDGISATIEDNGKGFDTTDKQKFEGIGLKNIISRIQFLKGTVDFDSTQGKGTLVAIHVP